MADMSARELQVWLRDSFPLENEHCEFKEWRSLKSNISGRKGEDLVSYVSALANMDGGCIVIGVQDKTLRVTGIEDFADYTPENILHRILGKAPGLPSVGLKVEPMHTSDTDATVWVVHVPRHAPRQPVLAHDKPWQRDGDSLTDLREDRHLAILTELIVGEDWSAEVVPGASAADLDPVAILKAREKYAAKHQRERWASEIPAWSLEQFLDKARMSLHGQITRTALLLLGRAQSAAWLSPNPAEITWKVTAGRVGRPVASDKPGRLWGWPTGRLFRRHPHPGGLPQPQAGTGHESGRHDRQGWIRDSRHGVGTAQAFPAVARL